MRFDAFQLNAVQRLIPIKSDNRMIIQRDVFADAEPKGLLKLAKSSGVFGAHPRFVVTEDAVGRCLTIHGLDGSSYWSDGKNERMVIDTLHGIGNDSGSGDAP